MAGKRQSRPAAFKAQVGLAAVKGDRTLNQLASHFGVHPTQIHAWKRQLVAGAEAVFASGAKAARLESLLLKNRDLRERERKFVQFMGRFALGYVSADEMKRLLADQLPPNDFETLFSHAKGPSRPWRHRSQIIFFHLCGIPKRLIAEFLGLYFRTVKKCILRYVRKGVASLFVRRSGVRKYDDIRYKEMIFAILHSPPKDYGFNRAAWRRRDIHAAAGRLGMPIGKNYIDRIIRDAGYRFQKARVVLTSNDPCYRE
ncbi:MAG TPA: hypothetical protein VGY54_18085, partial [Polyangiaceae bacterium]|nr:hypothetical protein [Polyangiaceae bacterium]